MSTPDNKKKLKRPLPIEFNVNENEYFQLKRMARDAGFKATAQYVRAVLFSDKEKKIVLFDRSIMTDIYRELNAIGNNVNQIARIANIDKRISPERINSVMTIFHDVIKVIDTKLGGL